MGAGSADPPGPFGWAYRGGYECSSKGDRRFSAFHARLQDGRTIEEHYQCDVKGYDPGGIRWRRGKGKPALDPATDVWAGYLALWRQWADRHPLEMELLATAALRDADGRLSDTFAISPVNQAHALAVLLNERHGTR